MSSKIPTNAYGREVRVQMSIAVPYTLRQRIENAAKKAGVPKSTIVAEACEAHLKKLRA